ncbi:hypothetical protein DITRI_Ditri12bG0175500 [Diplodiscus trichospermus]
MARFRSHSLSLLFQVFSPLLLLIFTITIHSSYGDDEDQEPQPLRGLELVELVCNYTSDSKFCVDNISSFDASPLWEKAGEICATALQLGRHRAEDAQTLIASLLQTSSAQQNRELLQSCQFLNEDTIDSLTRAADNLNSYSVDSMVDYLNDAANATKSCQLIIRGTDFSALANTNNDVIKFCEISIMARNFFTFEDFEKKL